MGILQRLISQTGGSEFSINNGATPTSIASTTDSKLHGTFDGQPGYSTNGAFEAEVTQQWNEYNDGMTNALPRPSDLDMNTNTPPSYESTFLPKQN